MVFISFNHSLIREIEQLWFNVIRKGKGREAAKGADVP
jgi:hypothetical protein